MKWTTKDIERLKQMYLDNKTVLEISKELKRTPRSIANKAYRLEITNPKNYTEEEASYITKNYKSYNLKEIAEKLGRPKENICRYVRELGLDRTHKKKESTKGSNDEFGVWHTNDWVRKTNEEIADTRSKIMKEWHANNEHPKGMKGKKHSLEFIRKTSERVKKYFEEVTPENLELRRMAAVKTKIENGTLNPNKNLSNPYSRTKSGKRLDLGNVFMRSAWEANIARYFNHNNIKWEFEPKIFVFKDLKRGCVSYTPDFYLPDLDMWVEVKGWMDDKSRVKLERFSRYYPVESEKLWLIDAKEYRIIEKKYKNLIEEWEHPKSKS